MIEVLNSGSSGVGTPPRQGCNGCSRNLSAAPLTAKSGSGCAARSSVTHSQAISPAPSPLAPLQVMLLLGVCAAAILLPAAATPVFGQFGADRDHSGSVSVPGPGVAGNPVLGWSIIYSQLFSTFSGPVYGASKLIVGTDDGLCSAFTTAGARTLGWQRSGVKTFPAVTDDETAVMMVWSDGYIQRHAMSDFTTQYQVNLATPLVNAALVTSTSVYVVTTNLYVYRFQQSNLAQVWKSAQISSTDTISTVPAIQYSGTNVLVTTSGRLQFLNSGSGAFTGYWTWAGGIASSPLSLPSDHEFYGSRDGKLLRAGPTATSPSYYFSMPSSCTGYVYMQAYSAATSRLYISCESGTLTYATSLTGSVSVATGIVLSGGQSVSTQPLIDSNGIVYVADSGGYVRAYTADLVAQWVYDLGSDVTSPSRLAMGTNNDLYVYSKSNTAGYVRLTRLLPASPTPSRTPSISVTRTASLSAGASASNTPSKSPTASITPTASLSFGAKPPSSESSLNWKLIGGVIGGVGSGIGAIITAVLTHRRKVAAQKQKEQHKKEKAAKKELAAAQEERKRTQSGSDGGGGGTPQVVVVQVPTALSPIVGDRSSMIFQSNPLPGAVHAAPGPATLYQSGPGLMVNNPLPVGTGAPQSPGAGVVVMQAPYANPGYAIQGFGGGSPVAVQIANPYATVVSQQAAVTVVQPAPSGTGGY